MKWILILGTPVSIILAIYFKSLIWLGPIVIIWIIYLTKSKSSNGIAMWELLDHDEEVWELSCPEDSSLFYKELSSLIEEDLIIYLEDGSWDTEIKEFFLNNKIDSSIIPGGTLWPKPKAVHLRSTKENLYKLAKLQENHAEPEIAMHIHVYRKPSKLILEWHDAFDNSICVNKNISEQKIKNFCQHIGIKYKKIKIV
jgi:hypothetical protein